MSDVTEELIGRGFNKKRLIGVILVAVLLLSIFAWQNIIFSIIMGTKRPFPNEQLEGAPYEDAELIMPPFPFDLQDIIDALQDVENIDEILADLDMTEEEIAEVIEEMFDGQIDDLNLYGMGAAIVALMYSEVEVFRVGQYTSHLDINNMSDYLWRYECFDQFSGDSWSTSATKGLTTGFPYATYWSTYEPQGIPLIKIKMPLSPSEGSNSFVIPALFPEPNIMDNSFQADNLDTDNSYLFKDGLNCSTTDQVYTTAGDVNMTYELFGYKLPTNNAVNNSAVDELNTPASIKNQYIKLSPTIPDYLSNNPNVNTHYLILNSIIEPQDHAFVVANKIRNYLQDNFTFSTTEFLNDGPAEGEDEVDWFCRKGEGIWTHFASAFCVFSRLFGVASRFVDGFNSRNINQIWDDDLSDWAFAVKYKNMYNWAEVYIPTDVSGSGMWVQMDVLYDGFGPGATPMTDDKYNISLSVNGTIFHRTETANLTATLTSDDPGAIIYNRKITFLDASTGSSLGQAYTNNDGNASLYLDIDDTQVVGPHLIMASYDPATYANTTYLVHAPIRINLQLVNPTEFNKTTPANATLVQGFVDDPVTGDPVKYAIVNFVLLDIGTNNKRPNPFTPSFWYTDDTGVFDPILAVNTNFPGVPPGEYQIRVDFNGTFLGWPVPVPTINISSGRWDFNVTSEKEMRLGFYINNTDTYGNPSFSFQTQRYQTLNLTAYVINDTITKDPMPGEIVDFYDYTNGSTLIGSNTTDINGQASVLYNVGWDAIAGPNLLYAKVGLKTNYSYYILNENPNITIISGPTPREINRTTPGITQFSVSGNITDATNGKPISFSYVELLLRKLGRDNSTYLIPNAPINTGSDGFFDLTYDVEDFTPGGNYTLMLNFTGRIRLFNNPYWFDFNFGNTNVNATFAHDLRIEAADIFIFNLLINNFPADDYNNPNIFRFQSVNLRTYLQWGTDPLVGELVEFYDVTQSEFIGSNYTDSSGIARYTYFTNSSTLAGPHLIQVSYYNQFYNYSYFILDDQITFNITLGPSPSLVNCSTSNDRTFIIRGFLVNGTYGDPIKYGYINVYLIDNDTKLLPTSSYISLIGGSLYLNETGEIYLVYYVQDSVSPGTYKIRIDFNGTFVYGAPNDLSALPSFNNPHIFNLPSLFSNSSFGLTDLIVQDPENITIYLSIDGNATRTMYDDNYLPNFYNRNDNITFQVNVTQHGSGVDTGTVRIYDVYNNDLLLDSYTYQFGDNGSHQFVINTSSWHAGLHLIKLNYSIYGAFNITYIIINETIDIIVNPFAGSIQRAADSLIITGHVEESLVDLRDLKVGIRLINGTWDYTQYLVFEGGYQQNMTIAPDGTYEFRINYIDINCPRGEMYIRIDFNGSFFIDGVPIPVLNITDYMVHTNSSLYRLNITAAVSLSGDYHTIAFPSGWYSDDTCNINGTIEWDNGNPFWQGWSVNITIRDGNGDILNSTLAVPDFNGNFSASFTVGDNWDANTKIYISFYPQDSLGIPDQYYLESIIEIEIFRKT